jgi:hypothetical protein
MDLGLGDQIGRFFSIGLLLEAHFCKDEVALRNIKIFIHFSIFYILTKINHFKTWFVTSILWFQKWFEMHV